MTKNADSSDRLHAVKGLFEGLAGGQPIETLALYVAQDEYPQLSIPHELAQFDALASPLLRERLSMLSVEEQAVRLGERLVRELGFRGNEEDYYDPKNSYLNDVISRRLGIPLTLAIVWIAVGRRAGLQIDGIGFPGHFLIRVGGSDGVFVDPFFGGRVLTESSLARLAQKFLGDANRLGREHLSPIDARGMVVRLLVNLKHVHERNQDHARALVVSDRLVDMTASLAFRRDRGLHALALGANSAAIADLTAYLADTQDAPDQAAVKRALERAKGRAVAMS